MDMRPVAGSELEYFPCRYGASKLVFRGPQKRLQGDYVVVLGGTETYGRFVEDPYPELLEEATGCEMVNLGYPNAGIDVFLSDETVIAAAKGARLVILQVPGALNLSNRFYTVHARRNDRFLRATPMLQAVFPEVDFTEFNFTRHLVGALAARAPERFALIRDELRKVWVARMNLLSATIDRKVLLAWIGTRRADEPAEALDDGGPAFVTRRMIDRLRGRIVDMVEVPFRPVEPSEDMVYGEAERGAARLLPGADTHRRLAEALAPQVLETLRRDATQSFSVSSGTTVKRSPTRP
ncbi:hypothetical protein SAMN04490244_10511 [Tranquillimonas rosea]|uniref:DUF6473 domain-containing protein n=1 Tax=Tranquillimonas rosea TaxID=641238 RepID=A0A1H9U3W6_9RHOB|nr:DUF6473 family protein [Tranquillimonas rosea]SES04012.1 hypothetical protein SAMN04490244_10511 [Tranquillimonas rosea]